MYVKFLSLVVNILKHSSSEFFFKKKSVDDDLPVPLTVLFVACPSCLLTDFELVSVPFFKKEKKTFLAFLFLWKDVILDVLCVPFEIIHFFPRPAHPSVLLSLSLFFFLLSAVKFVIHLSFF